MTDDVARHLSPWARQPAEPSTEAGKRLLGRQEGHARHGTRALFSVTEVDIAAIEAEAVAAERARIGPKAECLCTIAAVLAIVKAYREDDHADHR